MSAVAANSRRQRRSAPVRGMTTKFDNDTVYNQISIFLRNRAKRSVNTAKKYEKDIRYFFRFVKNKEIEDLTEEDLNITKADVAECQTHYASMYSNSSTDGRFTALVSLYNFLEDRYDVKKSVFKIDKLPDDSKKIGILSYDEVMRMIELAKYELYKANRKQAFLITALATGWRISMLLNIRPNDIRISEKDQNEVIIEPEYRDKGKQVKKILHKKWYDMILAMNGTVSGDKPIFSLTRDDVYNMFERLLKQMNIDPRRKISPHSLRKTSANLEYLFSDGDIFAVTRHGNWSSPDIVYRHYAEEKKSLTGVLLFEKFDEGVFEQLNRNELLELIKELPTEYQIHLKRKANEILKVNN